MKIIGSSMMTKGKEKQGSEYTRLMSRLERQLLGLGGWNRCLNVCLGSTVVLVLVCFVGVDWLLIG